MLAEDRDPDAILLIEQWTRNESIRCLTTQFKILQMP